MASRPGGPPSEMNPLQRFCDNICATGAHKSTRSRYARNLRKFIEGEAREMLPHKFNALLDDLNRFLLEMVSSNDVGKKMGALLVIDELIEVPLAENETKVIRFAHYLRMVFQQSTADSGTQQVLEQAAKTLGRLVSSGGTYATDIVEFEVKRALEWLNEGRSRKEQERHASVLVLKELAEKTPIMFSAYVDEFLNRIWVTIRDPKKEIREAGALALKACLELIANRAKTRHTQMIHQSVYQEVIKTFNNNTAEGIHGALLALRELLDGTGQFMLARFKEVCDLVLKHKDHKTPLVREAVVSTLPQIAKFAPEAFVRKYLTPSLKHVMKTVQAQGGEAFIALGTLAVAVKQSIEPQLAAIVALVQDGLSEKNKKRDSHFALECVSLLARAVGQRLVPYTKNLVDKMLNVGLSHNLVKALRMVVRHIPSLLPSIQLNLFNIIRNTLIQSSLKIGDSEEFLEFKDTNHIHLALATLGTFNFSPHSLVLFVHDVVLPYFNHSDPTLRERAIVTCCSILTAERSAWAKRRRQAARKQSADSRRGGGEAGEELLGARGYSPSESAVGGSSGARDKAEEEEEDEVEFNLLMDDSHLEEAAWEEQGPLSASSATSYSFDDYGRRQTSLAPPAVDSPQLLPPLDPVTHSQLTRHVLDRLLTSGAADPQRDIREKVLRSLDPCFDALLLEPQNLNALFTALNDEQFAICLASAKVIGRLAVRSPATLMPLLRKTLTQLLSDLCYSNWSDNTARQERCKVLAKLVTSSGQLLAPYTAAILQVLLPLLQHEDEGVKMTALEGLGHVAHVAGQQIMPFLKHIMPVILRVLGDQTGRKDVALATLWRLVRASGHVIWPYVEYPLLLPLILACLKGSNSWKTRKQGLRCLGVVGAVDPHVMSQTQLALKLARDKRESAAGDKTDSKGNVLKRGGLGRAAGEEGALPPLSQSSDEYFPAVALAALMRLLREQGLSQHHQPIISAAMKIIKSLGKAKCVHFLPLVIPSFLACLRADEPGQPTQVSTRSSIFESLGELALIVEVELRPFLPRIFRLMEEHWVQREVLSTLVLPLAQKLARVHAMQDDFKRHLAVFLPHLLQLLTCDRSPERRHCLRALEGLAAFGPLLEDHLHIVVPPLLRLAEGLDAPPHIRAEALLCLALLAVTGADLRDFATRIVLPLTRILTQFARGGVGGGLGGGGGGGKALQGARAVGASLLKGAVLRTLCVFVYHLGAAYSILAPVVENPLLRAFPEGFSPYTTMVERLQRRLPLQPEHLHSAVAAVGGGDGGAASGGANDQSAVVGMLGTDGSAGGVQPGGRQRGGAAA